MVRIATPIHLSLGMMPVSVFPIIRESAPYLPIISYHEAWRRKLLELRSLNGTNRGKVEVKVKGCQKILFDVETVLKRDLDSVGIGSPFLLGEGLYKIPRALVEDLYNKILSVITRTNSITLLKTFTEHDPISFPPDLVKYLEKALSLRGKEAYEVANKLIIEEYSRMKAEGRRRRVFGICGTPFLEGFAYSISSGDTDKNQVYLEKHPRDYSELQDLLDNEREKQKFEEINRKVPCLENQIGVFCYKEGRPFFLKLTATPSLWKEQYENFLKLFKFFFLREMTHQKNMPSVKQANKDFLKAFAPFHHVSSVKLAMGEGLIRKFHNTDWYGWALVWQGQIINSNVFRD
ncbi:MAG: hypothetical protein NZM65_10125 [Flavobacteriales bacterium]|nr:hypothetical protein [Flavobacteriales bacterium]MDW8411029.1 hypothetical protein [Flavobacteriales bacterium]